MEFVQSEYDAPQFVDFQKTNLPEADDSWFDKKEFHENGQPLSVCRHSATTGEPKIVETSPKLRTANMRREVSEESTENRLLRQIHKEREDELKRAECRKQRAFMSPRYAPIRSEKELTRPIEPILATELRSRLRAKKNISVSETKVYPNIKRPPPVQKQKSYPPPEPQPKPPKTGPLPHRTLDKKPVHEGGATGLSWKREQSTLSQPEPFHLRTDERFRRKLYSDSIKNISHSCGVKSKTQPDTLLEQSKEEQENKTVSPKVPFGAKGITRVDTPRKNFFKHNVSCQPLNDTSNSLEVLDEENSSKKRKQTNLDEINSTTKRQRSSPTPSANPLPEVSATPPEPIAPLM